MLTMTRKKRAPADLTPEDIRNIRKKLGLNQRQAAERIGVARRTWMYWESAKRGQAPSTTAIKLIRMLEAGKL